MNEDLKGKFIAAVKKGLTDEMIAEQMDMTVKEVRRYRRLLLPEQKDEEDATPRD
jgi:hypothetical protein